MTAHPNPSHAPRARWLAVVLLAAACSPSSSRDSEAPDWSTRAAVLRRELVDREPSTGLGYVPGRLIVRFRDGVGEAAAASLHTRAGGTLLREVVSRSGMQRVQLKNGQSLESALAAYRASPNVLYAEPDYRVRIAALPTDTRFTEQWALHNLAQTLGTADADINAPEAWALPSSDQEPVVGIIDSGADLNHPDLVGRLWTNPGEIPGNNQDDDGNGYVDDVHGIDASSTNRAAQPIDVNGHGTHVAGIIAATANNAVGVAGTSPKARLALCRFIGADGGGATSDAIECLAYFRALKSRAQNPVALVATSNSWGGNEFSQALEDEIRAHAGAEILFVVAAGNDGRTNDVTAVYPSDIDQPNVISVAASDASDGLAGFTNFGKHAIHVAAPGVEILSTFPDDGYAVLDGTSMATPYVSGLVALLKSQTPSRRWYQIRNLVIAGGQPVPAMAPATLSGRRIKAAGKDGLGSMTCSGQTVKARRAPVEDEVALAVGNVLRLSMLSITCADPVGPVQVQVSSGGSVSLRDDGVSPDQVAGDGLFVGAFTVPSNGVHTLSFPDGGAVKVVANNRQRPVVTAPTAELRNFIGQPINVALSVTAAAGTGPFTVEAQFAHKGVFTSDTSDTIELTRGTLQRNPLTPGRSDGLVRVTDAEGQTSQFKTITTRAFGAVPRILAIAADPLVIRANSPTRFLIFVEGAGNDNGPWDVEYDLDYDGVTFTPDGSGNLTSTITGVEVEHTFPSNAVATVAARVTSAQAGLSAVFTQKFGGTYDPAQVVIEPVGGTPPGPTPGNPEGPSVSGLGPSGDSLKNVEVRGGCGAAPASDRWAANLLPIMAMLAVLRHRRRPQPKGLKVREFSRPR